MGQDEQIEEREVLDSIFPDEITDLSENSYRVAIALDIPREDDDENEPPTLLLTVTYPPTYPDVAPELELMLPPHHLKHPHLDLSRAKPILLAQLTPLISDALGCAMIFTLISSIKEGAEDLIAASVAAEQDVRDAEKRKEEEEEDKKFSGRRVTRESFAEWREAFRREVSEREGEEERRREELEGKKKPSKEGKLTGKELWERGLVGKIEEDDEGTAGMVEGLRELKVGG